VAPVDLPVDEQDLGVLRIILDGCERVNAAEKKLWLAFDILANKNSQQLPKVVLPFHQYSRQSSKMPGTGARH